MKEDFSGRNDIVKNVISTGDEPKIILKSNNRDRIKGEKSSK